MRLLRIVVTVALAGTLALVVGVRTGPAAAAGLQGSFVHPSQVTATDDAYDIEGFNFYCNGGGSQCAAGNGNYVYNCTTACPGMNYGDAEAYGLPNGSPSGTPAALYLECDHYTSAGDQQAVVSVYSAAGQSDYQNLYSKIDLGTIAGNATLLSWFQENPNFPYDDGEGNPAQTSSINASAIDPNGGYFGYGTHGTVTGIQNTNNTDEAGDTLNSGSFRITITGEIDIFTDSPYVPTSYYMGTISCMAGGP